MLDQNFFGVHADCFLCKYMNFATELQNGCRNFVEIKNETMNEVFELINEMSPYLLLGFLLAGVMHAFVPNRVYGKYLGCRSFRSVAYAALIGVPLPLCSCGVIPTAMSLRREGASKGATVSFMISTPQTGVDSMIATYSLMGLPFALLRPIVAFATAVFGGQMVNLFDCGDDDEPLATKRVEEEKLTFGQKFVSALKYAFVEMMQDIGKWLVVGLVVAGLITVFVPEEFFASFADNSLLSMLVVLAIAVPMYICATGSIPIAVALMLKGLSPGAALVLLMAGPAANAASILVVNKVLGRRTLMVYLASIVGGAMAFGLMVDYLLPREWFLHPLSQIVACSHGETQWFNIGCSILLGLLLVNALLRRYISHDKVRCHDCDIHESRATEEIVLTIDGMSCSHCRKHVEQAIREVEGVESANVDLASRRAVVTGRASRAAISHAVEKAGFSVRPE